MKQQKWIDDKHKIFFIRRMLITHDIISLFKTSCSQGNKTPEVLFWNYRKILKSYTTLYYLYINRWHYTYVYLKPTQFCSCNCTIISMKSIDSDLNKICLLILDIFLLKKELLICGHFFEPNFQVNLLWSTPLFT